jgi:hypothetical protein
VAVLALETAECALAGFLFQIEHACIVRFSLKFSLEARVRARLPKVLFSLGRVSTAFRISIVSFKENANTDSLIQPALQFLNVEIWFLMLA